MAILSPADVQKIKTQQAREEEDELAKKVKEQAEQ